jgi:uncharacterized protein (TIGR03435 family)
MRALLLLLIATSATAQGVSPAFEVASIKPHTNTDNLHSFQFLPGGRFHAANTWIKFVIQQAYDLKDYQVTGGPSWVSDVRFDIDAKAPNANATEAEMRKMLQSLLAERCHLKISYKTGEFGVYDLVVDKGGPRLAALKPGDVSKCNRDNSEICGLSTVAKLAKYLESPAHRPVFDRTGIEGRYDILLTFDVYDAQGRQAPPGYEKPVWSDALREQLGLKVEARKAQLPVLVIESVERPSAN